MCLGALSPFKVCLPSSSSSQRAPSWSQTFPCQVSRPVAPSTGAYAVSLECLSVLLWLPWELVWVLHVIPSLWKQPSKIPCCKFQSTQTTRQSPREGLLHHSSSSSGALVTGDDRSPLKAEVAVTPESHSQHASSPLVRIKVIFPMPYWNICLSNAFKGFSEGQEQKQSMERAGSTFVRD